MSLLPFPEMRTVRRTTEFLLRCAAFAILFLFVLCTSESLATDSNQFIKLAFYPSGGTPIRMVTADFNRDGKEDIVVLNSNDVLSSLLGNGKGGFAAPRTIATLPASSAAFPTLMVAGDFNGDGNQDLALVPSPGNIVKVFLGHGDGTFAAPVSIKDGLLSAGDLAVGDFNGDDRTDIVVAGATSVAVLEGKSSGIFGTPIVTATNLTAPDHLILAVGDVNRDSHLDVAVTDKNGGIQLLLGTGSGTFHLKPAVSYSSYPAPPNVIAIADFNGDGKPDIAAGIGAIYPYWYPSSGQVCLLFGYGDGTFDLNSQKCYDAQDRFDEMLVANLNGKPGLLFPADPMIVELNSNSGALTQSSYAVGSESVALGDFNGDRKQDIAVGAAGGLQVVLNLGSGLMHAPLSMSDVGGALNLSMTMNGTDFNGDGYADLTVLSFRNEDGLLEPSVSAVLGGAKNLLTTSSTNGLGFYSNSTFISGPPAIGDFNHDGYLDIAIGATGGVSWWDAGESSPYVQVLFGDGKGHFPPPLGPELDINTNFFAAGDFNGDGNTGLASLNGSTFEILMGKGDGTFAPAVTYPVGANPVFVLKRDLNGDGKTDIIVVNHDSNDVSVLLGRGDGTFLPQKTFAAGTAPVAAVTGDFNRDGKVDIAVASSKGVSILLGNGNGTFQAQKTYSASGPMTGIVEASLRQDGIEDLIGIDSASQRFVLLPGVGNGTFGAPVVYPLDRVPTQIVAGDFNHDGATDIALLGNGSVAFSYNQGGDHVALASSASKPKSNQSVTFTARVATSYGETGTPSGKVTFTDGTRILGNGNLKTGEASVVTKLTAGTHKVLAKYAGDTNFNSNQSSTLTIVVVP